MVIMVIFEKLAFINVFHSFLDRSVFILSFLYNF
jgi:hypothetical protein